MRLFVAIVPPPEVRDRLARVRDVLAASGADVKWVRTGNLHMTLKFLGEVDATRVGAITQALTTVAVSHAPLEVHYATVGAFPNRRRPRVIWVGTTGALLDLQASVEQALERIGFAAEQRAWTPHLTLGRARSDRGGEQLLARLNEVATEDCGRATVGAITLMESTLSARGPTYRIVQDISLGKR